MSIIIKKRIDGVTQRFHISPLRPKIKELYTKGLSSRVIGKKLGISHARVLKILRSENIKRRNNIKSIPNKNYKKLSQERAYLLGVMCGDGCVFSGKVNKEKYNYNLYVVYLAVRDKEFIDEFIRCMEIVYGFTPSLYLQERNKINKKWSDIWVAKTARKEVYLDLGPYNFGTKTWRVPNEIMISNNKKIIGSFLKGFYDSEGSVLVGPRSFSITSHSTNLNGLEDIKQLLKKLGIESSRISIDKRPNQPVFYFSISRKSNAEIFLNRVGFTILRKRIKAEENLK